MSRERELLERAMSLIDYRYAPSEAVAVHREIQELLAQPEQEPVVWGSFNFNNECVGTGSKRIAAQIQKNNKIYPLYTSPLKREPLTDESICEILLKKEWFGFIELVRMIEKAHGIGGGK